MFFIHQDDAGEMSEAIEEDSVLDRQPTTEERSQGDPDMTEGNTREKVMSGTVSEGEEGPSDGTAPLLPRRTKVLVTGNNRTKSSLVGLEGYVKKAVGLGGWHWLVLSNGKEVKLQRNALSVLEAPSGYDEDEDDETLRTDNTDDLKKSGSRRRNRDTANNMNLYSRPYKRRPPPGPALGMRVNFNKLNMSALGKYRQHFQLTDVGPDSTRDQLVVAVEKHFTSQAVEENKIISAFVQAAKRVNAV